MKEIISIGLIIMLMASLFILTGCEKTDSELPEDGQTNEDVYIEEKVPTVIDRTNSVLQNDDEVKESIKVALPKYFDAVYGEGAVDEIEVGDIMIYMGDEEEMKYVDLTENDYAFQIDYKIKPASGKDGEKMTEYMGKYDKDSGWIIDNHGYGVMRYNVISKEFDITSISPDGF